MRVEINILQTNKYRAEQLLKMIEKRIYIEINNDLDLIFTKEIIHLST